MLKIKRYILIQGGKQQIPKATHIFFTTWAIPTTCPNIRASILMISIFPTRGILSKRMSIISCI